MGRKKRSSPQGLKCNENREGCIEQQKKISGEGESTRATTEGPHSEREHIPNDVGESNETGTLIQKPQKEQAMQFDQIGNNEVQCFDGRHSIKRNSLQNTNLKVADISQHAPRKEQESTLTHNKSQYLNSSSPNVLSITAATKSTVSKYKPAHQNEYDKASVEKFGEQVKCNPKVNTLLDNSSIDDLLKPELKSSNGFGNINENVTSPANTNVTQVHSDSTIEHIATENSIASACTSAPYDIKTYGKSRECINIQNKSSEGKQIKRKSRVNINKCNSKADDETRKKHETVSLNDAAYDGVCKNQTNHECLEMYNTRSTDDGDQKQVTETNIVNKTPLQAPNVKNRHRRKNKYRSKEFASQNYISGSDEGEKNETGLKITDSEAILITHPMNETKSHSSKNLCGDLSICNYSREQRMHSLLRKKLLQRAEEKLRNEITSANISSSEKSEKYLDQLTKELKLLTGSSDATKTGTNFGDFQLKNNAFAFQTENDEDGDEFEYTVIQRVVFQSYACHVCKALTGKLGSTLKRCIQCKMISYCSKEHQRDHWPVHRDLCKVICKIYKSEGSNHLFEKALGLSAENYRHYRIHYINECTSELGRDLQLWEREMFYYAEVCHTCYQCDRNQLTTCKNCYHVSYCQPDHLNQNHSVWCKDFKLYSDITRYQAKLGMIQPKLPNHISLQHKSLPENMEKYISEIEDHSNIPDPLTYAILTDIATCPLTVLFALERCYSSLDAIETLTVHMVGAEMHFEADTMKKWEVFILHSLPHIIHLKVVFIGPELKLYMIPNEMLTETKCCKYCSSVGHYIEFQFCPGLFYHDYVKTEKYSHPDLICALNAGLYRTTGFEGKDTWPSSIKAMLTYPCAPVVVTAYTEEELPLDVQRVKEFGQIKVILPPMKNPYSSCKPSLNFVTEEKVPVIFKNFYITILQGINVIYSDC